MTPAEIHDRITWRNALKLALLFAALLALSVHAGPVNPLAQDGIRLCWNDPSSNIISHYVVYEWDANARPVKFTIKTSYVQNVVIMPVTNNGTNGLKVCAVAKDGTWSAPSTNIYVVLKRDVSSPTVRTANSALK